MASYDIEITTDDTLELDTIIQKSSSAKKPINNVTYDGSSNYSKSILDGFETKTAVFNPPEAGVYHIDINGQELSINVTDASTILDGGDLYAAFLPNYLSTNYNDGDNIPNWQSNDGSITISDSDTGDQPAYDANKVSTDGAAEFDGYYNNSTEGTNLKTGGLATLSETDGFCAAALIREKSPLDYTGILAPSHSVDGDANQLWQLRYAEDEYIFPVDGDFSISAPDFDDSNAHTVIGNLDNGTGELYLDGGSPSATGDLSSASFSTSSLTVGQFSADSNSHYGWDGYISAILVYQSGKTETEVGDIHNFLINL